MGACDKTLTQGVTTNKYFINWILAAEPLQYMERLRKKCLQ